ncbi:AcrB/AcrD/AcrF family protein [Brevinema andersonii]|uniref:AcrB/AcrD/AcrF family protein n=1 Tax=Brevinema andersonii TaxID=34097 RepID=A0A1I1F925_BREAD|nr:efflux RND transporter permease subunit [Brevinema andersonii]SFB95456.1 AcrB/AcrD/AcrF family protein [Brevinema andersonii]
MFPVVALNQVANFSEEKESTKIRSENGLYTVKVLDTMQNVNVLSNNTFSILSKIEKQFANKTNQLTAAPYFENEKEETAKRMKEIGITVALGLVLIFGLLIFLFNSYIHTIIVLSVTPFISVCLVIRLTNYAATSE